MKRTARLLTLLLALVMAFSLAIPAAAATGTKNVKITYRNIRVVLDGKEIIPKDANGNSVEPFIMGGTTYLPVRAVAGALGIKVFWNGDTNTVVLNSGANSNLGSGSAIYTNATKSVSITYRDIKITLDGKAIMPTDAKGSPVEPFIMGGTTYLPVRAVANALGVNVQWDSDTSTVILGENLEYKNTWLVKSEEEHANGGALLSRGEYTYDAKGNCLTYTHSGNGKDYTTAYTYDMQGELTKTATRDRINGTSSVEYINGMPCRYTYSDGSWETYGYDSHGNMTKYVYSWDGVSGSTTYTNTYDSHDNLSEARVLDKDSSGYNQEYVLYYSYTYDAMGNMLTQKSWDSRTVSGSKVPTYEYWTYTYDSCGRVVAQTYVQVENNVKTVTQNTTITYNAYGFMSSYSCNGTKQTFTYDSQGRLTAETNGGTRWTYTYDANSNMTRCSCSDGSYTVYTYVAIKV